MYVCVYVCMSVYVCMYVCMYACIHACLHVCNVCNVCIHIYTHICIDIQPREENTEMLLGDAKKTSDSLAAMVKERFEKV